MEEYSEKFSSNHFLYVGSLLYLSMYDCGSFFGSTKDAIPNSCVGSCSGSVIGVGSSTVGSGCITGAGSVTVIFTSSLSSDAPFFTTISKTYEAGPCDSVGVHVNCPVSLLIDAPVGGFFSRLNVTPVNDSVNVGVNNRVFFSSTVLSEIESSANTKFGIKVTFCPSNSNCIDTPSSILSTNAVTL